MIEFSRQRVRPQTKFHQRFGFRQTGIGKPMIRLIAQHGVVGRCVPHAIRIPPKVTLTNQRLLNFLYALWLQVQSRQTLSQCPRATSPTWANMES